MEENEMGNPNELGMDLDLKIGLPSPPHLISYLGLGLEPEQETPFHVVSPSHWFSQIPSAGGHDSKAAARRGHLTVEEGSSSGGACLVVNSEGEGRGSRCSHYGERRRHLCSSRNGAGTQKPDPKRLLAEALADETKEQRKASTSNFECEGAGGDVDPCALEFHGVPC